MFEPSLLGSERLRPLKRVEYERMIALGLFDEDERVELLDGMLVAVSPQGAAHAYVIQTLDALLHGLLAGRKDVLIRVQLPLALGDDSEPEPDVAVVPAGDYSNEHPTRALLIIEVAQASAQKDRRWKARVYASAGVAEYWLVDLNARAVEVLRDPRGDGYSRVERHTEDDALRAESVPGVNLTVKALLPRA